MVSATENTGIPSPLPNSPQVSTSVHRNKLTQCFDDIMRVASEMMVQQQLKTVQLDSSLVNGFSQTQQKLLGEKIHMFHAILDDLESTLHKSKTYVESVYDCGIQKEKQKEKERQELRRRQEQEEEQVRRQQEQKRQQEREMKAQEEEMQQNQSHLNNSDLEAKIDFSIGPSDGLLMDFGSSNADISVPGVLSAQDGKDKSSNGLHTDTQVGQHDSHIRQHSVHQSPNQDQMKQQLSPQHNAQQPSNDQDGLGMGMSMLSGLENGDLDMSDFNSGINEAKDKSEINPNHDNNMQLPDSFQRASQTTNDVASLNDAPTNALGDNEDDYLTLNDFNDFNIDWNAPGNPGDLDLNGFNI